jgi:hypothetical protein
MEKGEKEMNLISTSLKSALVAISFVGLVACEEIKIKNGEVPENYIGVVNELVGVYHGRLQGFPATIEIRLRGNKPVLIYRDQSGTDVIHPSCRSQIGDLSTIKVGTKDGAPVLYDAWFNFDAGDCWSQVRGRSIGLSFFKRRDRQHIDIRLLKDVRWEQRCTQTGDPRWPTTSCQSEQVPVYMMGRFSR